MFKTYIGALKDKSSRAYLRPETAQGIFANYKNILDTQRVKVPFGIAQIGKAFRNEVNPGNFIFRVREFEQMELEYFVEPGTDEGFFEKWVDERMNWYINVLGLDENKLRKRPHAKDELAHYAKSCIDIEYYFPFGWSELEGIASRTDFDLSQHQKHSGEDLRYFDSEKNKRYIPYVIEPSCGIDRIIFAILCDGYEELEGGRSEEGNKDKSTVETVIKMKREMSPIKVAVLPLLKNKKELVDKAKEVYKILSPNFMCQYDASGSIGRRYRRQDEIGTVAAVTIDFDTLEDNTVTVRDRDTMEQERIKIDELINYLKTNMNI